ncbi:MAG: FHA domain-containing protein [Chloroflexota bacterium]
MDQTTEQTSHQALIEVRPTTGKTIQHVVKNVITYIGTDSACDIVLSSEMGRGIAKRHAQFIYLPESDEPYRFLSLSTTVGQSDAAGNEDKGTLFTSQPVKNGDQIQIGQYILIFHLGADTPAADTTDTRQVPASVPPNTDDPDSRREESFSKSIGLHLFLPTTKLKPGEPIFGSVTVSNIGDQSGVKFRLKVAGLHQDIYILNAGPLLPLSASADINFYLYHTERPEPEAGNYPFTLEAMAEEAYGDETVSVSQKIEVLPFYKHELTLEVK